MNEDHEDHEDPMPALDAIVAAARQLMDHPVPQVRTFAAQVTAKVEALTDAVLPHRRAPL